MIVHNLVLILAIAIPVLAIVLLRTNAVMVFVGLAIGALLLRYVGNDASLVGLALSNNSGAAAAYAKVAVLLIPALLCLIFLRKSVKGPASMINILPAIGASLVGVLLVAPLLPSGAQLALAQTQSWSVLVREQEMIVIVTSIGCLLLLLKSQQRPKDDKKHRRH